MPVMNDKYDQLKVDKLKHFLLEMAAKGQSRPYEIFVDNLKVVPKTEDPKDFENYEYYMNEDTEKIRILIYNSNLSPRNDQYCFFVQQGKPEKSLNGLGEIEGIIQEKLAIRDREHEMNRLQTELEETKKQLEESEEYAETLERQLEETKSNKYKLGKLDLVELGGIVLEKLAIKNSQALEKMGLSGLIAPGQTTDVQLTEETQASFQKRNEDDTVVKPEHLQYIPVLQQLDNAFDSQQLETVMKVLGKFSEEPAHLKTVAGLLNIETT